MRKVLRRLSLAILAAGLAGSAALGLGRPTDPPPLDGPIAPPAAPAILPVAAVVPLAVSKPGPGSAPETPAVTLAWAGPAEVKVHHPVTYTLTATNTGTQPVQKVTLQVRVPKGATAHATSPAADLVGGVYVWDVGTLEPAAAKAVKLTLTHEERGEPACRAWVTFTGTAGITTVVREPKLEVTISAPATVALGDKVPVTYTVKNTGDAAAENVRPMVGEHRTASLTDDTPARNATDADIPNIGALKPGQVYVGTAEFKADRGGKMSLTAGALADAGAGATADATVRVLVPKLDAVATGPAEVLVGRKAKYAVKVTNSGELPLDGVTVAGALAAGFKPCPNDARAVRLVPGEAAEWAFEGVAAATGPANHTFTATGSRGTKADATCKTAVDGVPGMRMEVMDSVDPVEKGGETTYEIRLTNTGTKADAGLVLECELPPQLELASATGPTESLQRIGVNEGRRQNHVRFDPVTELAPKAEAVFRVKVRAVGTGDVRFKASLTSKHLPTPVVKEESTRVYGE